jgi:hypothetical protein
VVAVLAVVTALWSLFLVLSASFAGLFGFAYSEPGFVLEGMFLIVLLGFGRGLYSSGLAAIGLAFYTPLLSFTAGWRLIGGHEMHWYIFDRHVGEWTYGLLFIGVAFVIAGVINSVMPPRVMRDSEAR